MLLMLALAGCNHRIKKRLIQEIDKVCERPTNLGCTIMLKKVAPFQWDKLYFFGSWTTRESIEDMIGLKYTGEDVEDDCTRMLFVQGNTIVHEEDFYAFDYQSSTVSFPEIVDSLQESKEHFLTPDNAVFSAEKSKGDCAGCFSYGLSLKKRFSSVE